jgi:hypothetical protein
MLNVLSRSSSSGDTEVLEGDRWPAAVAGQQCQPGAQPATGAAAVDRDALGVHTELRGVRAEPRERGVAVLQACGERVLRGQPVVHRDDHGADAPRHRDAAGVRRLEAAEHEATGMHIENPDGGRPRVGAVDPHRDVGGALGGGHRAVRDRQPRGVGRGELGQHRREVRAGGRDVAEVELRESRHRRGELGIGRVLGRDRHGCPPALVLIVSDPAGPGTQCRARTSGART